MTFYCLGVEEGKDMLMGGFFALLFTAVTRDIVRTRALINLHV